MLIRESLLIASCLSHVHDEADDGDEDSGDENDDDDDGDE